MGLPQINSIEVILCLLIWKTRHLWRTLMDLSHIPDIVFNELFIFVFIRKPKLLRRRVVYFFLPVCLFLCLSVFYSSYYCSFLFSSLPTLPSSSSTLSSLLSSSASSPPSAFQIYHRSKWKYKTCIKAYLPVTLRCFEDVALTGFGTVIANTTKVPVHKLLDFTHPLKRHLVCLTNYSKTRRNSPNIDLVRVLNVCWWQGFVLFSTMLHKIWQGHKRTHGGALLFRAIYFQWWVKIMKVVNKTAVLVRNCLFRVCRITICYE